MQTHFGKKVILYKHIILCVVFISGGLILAMIEGVGIAINRAVSEQFKPHLTSCVWYTLTS